MSRRFQLPDEMSLKKNLNVGYGKKMISDLTMREQTQSIRFSHCPSDSDDPNIPPKLQIVRFHLSKVSPSIGPTTEPVHNQFGIQPKKLSQKVQTHRGWLREMVIRFVDSRHQHLILTMASNKALFDRVKEGSIFGEWQCSGQGGSLF